mgnify:CR=1 FL=1
MEQNVKKEECEDEVLFTQTKYVVFKSLNAYQLKYKRERFVKIISALRNLLVMSFGSKPALKPDTLRCRDIGNPHDCFYTSDGEPRRNNAPGETADGKLCGMRNPGRCYAAPYRNHESETYLDNRRKYTGR